MPSSYTDGLHHTRQAFAQLAVTMRVCYFLRLMTAEQMKQRLVENYPNGKIEVFDLTGTSDHWEVYVEASNFAGMTRIQQHQHVMACFGPELKTGEVHALSIKTKVI
jgi:Predicted transcriptional regulator, BolA superfamily